ncbi:MAG: HEAT repeat domain-containing protein [Isosphaeraceae bacterium]
MLRLSPRGLPALVLAACLVAGCGRFDGVSTGAGAVATPASIDDAIKGLRAKDPTTRAKAAVRLAAMGPAASPAVSPLTAALKDRDVSVKAAAAHALGEIGPDARPALPELTALARHRPLTEVSSRAIEKIGRAPGAP